MRRDKKAELYRMAIAYEHGSEVCSRNVGKAIEYYQILADMGESQAISKIRELSPAVVAKPNVVETRKYQSSRCNIGSLNNPQNSQLYEMAQRFEYGTDVCAKNLSRAIEYYEILADKGEEIAVRKLKELGVFYRAENPSNKVTGNSNKINSNKFVDGIKSEKIKELYRMANAYEYGSEVCSRNVGKAIEYYQILADMGESQAISRIRELSSAVVAKSNVAKSEKEHTPQRNKTLRVIDILSQVTDTNFQKNEKISFELGNNIILPVIVAGTMSSGKSTLLNAILGSEILPNMNQACTNQVLKIMCGQWKKSTMFVAFNDGKKKVYNNVELRDVALANKMENVKDVVLLHHGDFYKNETPKLLFVDTPGINNNGDLRHMTRTKQELKNYSKAIIMYILNSEQIGTNDDNDFLQFVFELQKTKNDIDIVFVVNKVDKIDSEKESIPAFRNLCCKYLQNIGFCNPKIFMVSSLMYFLAKKALEKSPMTRCEKLMLENFVGYYVGDNSGEIEKAKKDDEYSLAVLKDVFMNSGISDLVSEIDKITKD